MVHISQVFVSCIVGHHDNNSLNESVVVFFSKHLYKSYMTQYLRIADSDSGLVEGPHNTDMCAHIPVPRGSAPPPPLPLLLAVRRWYNAETQVKLWLIGWMLALHSLLLFYDFEL